MSISKFLSETFLKREYSFLAVMIIITATVVMSLGQFPFWVDVLITLPTLLLANFVSDKYGH